MTSVAALIKTIALLLIKNNLLVFCCLDLILMSVIIGVQVTGKILMYVLIWYVVTVLLFNFDCLVG